ncbi:MAG: addiction module protein [Phycisphaera sp. RhM]|nr:addiction module protein [Phycisphaera sp. RhM]
MPRDGVPAIMRPGGKPMSLESMLASLTPEEKLNAMDILWRDLSANPARLPSPGWHGDVLAHRVANPSSEPRLPIDAAFDDVRERLNERRTQG